jgi:hypothetical protein
MQMWQKSGARFYRKGSALGAEHWRWVGLLVGIWALLWALVRREHPTVHNPNLT